MDEVIHCDRVAILRGGVLLSDSTPQELISSGRATVRIDHGGVPREYALADYPTELPALLRAEGLDPQTTRIEVSPASLEDVILGLIRPVGEG
jgi:ABC-type multidrug transport system ATPase subunit